ncbi:hypothetical protein Rhopal_006390-T1 [Rhodotorula paludigena]|uniref:C2H2-type domain-containing protein n=1 Tax=Rhodotorula paludigena TaxID=86838 RepID=A0AAV5GWC1_9BASI|nr:hypothetical protein Rhopal_006390-T1 [Rhodotorula paludigena]
MPPDRAGTVTQRHFCSHVGCGKSFSRADHLKRHTANHDPARVRTCPECGRGFARQDVLTAHLKKHDRPAPSEARSPSPGPPTSMASAAVPGDDGLSDLVAWLAAETSVPTDSGLSSWCIADMPSDLFTDWQLPPIDSNFPYDDVLAFELDQPLPPASALAAQMDDAPIASPVTEALRQTLIAYLSPFPDLAVSSAFSCHALSEALGRYWSEFAPQTPIVHAASWDPHDSTCLLATMVVAGLCFAPTSDSDEAYKLGAALAHHLRAIILHREATSVPVHVRAFQSLLILGQVASLLLGQEQHDLSFSYSSFELALGRAHDIYSYRFFHKHASIIRSLPTHDERWRAWSIAEQWRRCVFFVLMRDAQISSVFHHLPTRALSVFFDRVSLPCDDAHWHAASSAVWHSLARPLELLFPRAMTEALSRSRRQGHGGNVSEGVGEQDLSPHARLCVVHGLLAAAWDLRWRGALRAAAMASMEKTWRRTLQETYAQHRSEVYGEMAALSSGPGSASTLAILLATLDILLVAELELRADIVALRTFAGAERIAARTVGPEDYASAGKRVRTWVATSDALDAASLAAEYLRLRITEADIDSGWHPSRGLYGPPSIFLASVGGVLKKYRWAVAQRDADLLLALGKRKL